MADLKKLFALSYNSCALPGCEERLADESWPRVMAEICHIYGLRPGSARFVPDMTIAELNSYENLLLLCRNCHLKIDYLYVDDYPADRLLEIKHQHENRDGAQSAWCTPAQLERFVTTLAITLGINVLDAPPRPPSNHPPNMKIRVYELARELGLTNQEALDQCIAAGVEAKSHSSSISFEDAERVRDRAWTSGVTRLLQPRPQG